MAEIVNQRVPPLRIHVRGLVGHDIGVRVDSHHPGFHSCHQLVIRQRRNASHDGLELLGTLCQTGRADAFGGKRRQPGRSELVRLESPTVGRHPVGRRILPSERRQALDGLPEILGRKIEDTFSGALEVGERLALSGEAEHNGPAQCPGGRKGSEVR